VRRITQLRDFCRYLMLLAHCVRPGRAVTCVLAISSQHVVVLAAVIYCALHAFTLPATLRVCVTMGLIRPSILVTGAPSSPIRAGVVATLVLAARLFGRHNR
jgi:hypothetical protein